MKYSKIMIAVLIAALVLAACAPASAPVKYSLAQSTSTGCATPETGKVAGCKVGGAVDVTSVPTGVVTLAPIGALTAVPTASSTQSVEPQPDAARSDAQGSVTIQVKPLNLNKPGDTLVFDVSMNTHSVDLSMDLAKLAVLTTDTGKKVQAILWDAPRGGHHVEGKLSFPEALDGKNLLDGARSITITIKDVDAPSRTFAWQLNG
jgi:hypothetical protein